MWFGVGANLVTLLAGGGKGHCEGIDWPGDRVVYTGTGSSPQFARGFHVLQVNRC